MWNNSIHYYEAILRSVPRSCAKALDVGCGQGLLARKLAMYCDEVVALDVDSATLTLARQQGGERIDFLQADVMAYPFPAESFDAITAVATLHHLPLEPALQRFRELLKPGGVLAVIGLYRGDTFTDYAFDAMGLVASCALRLLKGWSEVAAPAAEPQETLDEIRAACRKFLPEAKLQRRILFRYTLFWRKPRLPHAPARLKSV